MTFAEIFSKIQRKYGYGLIHGDGVSRDEIERAQRELSMQFSDSYVQMLVHCGWFKVLQLDRQIWGLGEDLEKYETVTDQTQSWRVVKEMRFYKDRGFHPFPDYIAVISSDEFEVVGLDTSRLKDGECSVIESHYGDSDDYYEYDDFLDYLDLVFL
jgi:hypothetical protein